MGVAVPTNYYGMGKDLAEKASNVAKDTFEGGLAGANAMQTLESNKLKIQSQLAAAERAEFDFKKSMQDFEDARTNKKKFERIKREGIAQIEQELKEVPSSRVKEITTFLEGSKDLDEFASRLVRYRDLQDTKGQASKDQVNMANWLVTLMDSDAGVATYKEDFEVNRKNKKIGKGVETAQQWLNKLDPQKKAGLNHQQAEQLLTQDAGMAEYAKDPETMAAISAKMKTWFPGYEDQTQRMNAASTRTNQASAFAEAQFKTNQDWFLRVTANQDLSAGVPDEAVQAAVRAQAWEQVARNAPATTSQAEQMVGDILKNEKKTQQLTKQVIASIIGGYLGTDPAVPPTAQEFLTEASKYKVKLTGPEFEQITGIKLAANKPKEEQRPGLISRGAQWIMNAAKPQSARAEEKPVDFNAAVRSASNDSGAAPSRKPLSAFGGGE